MSQRKSFRSIRVTAITATYCLIAVWALLELPAGAEAQQDHQEQTAEQVYKNIQVLKGVPASQLNSIMSLMAGSLGVTCTHCHVNPWVSDVKQGKQVARKMIQMVMSINQGNFGGNATVTCYSCHRGQLRPESSLPPGRINSAKVELEAASTKPTQPLMAPDEIFDRYISALGGKAALARLKTRILKGLQVDTNGMTPPTNMQVEIFREAPNKIATITTSQRGTSAEGYDGAAGWIKNSRGQRQMDADELAQIRREADFLEFANFKQRYKQMTTEGREKIGDAEVYVVGAINTEGKRERLYFDSKSWLLVRRYVETKTVLGILPETTDFEDYKEIDGVKEPSVIRWVSMPYTSTRTFTEIKHNAPVGGGVFDSPSKQ